MTKKFYDDLWSLAVKILAGFRCEYCLGSNCLNSHHYFGRRYQSTRYDVKNGFCLCADHHINLAHQRSGEFSQWAIRRRGQVWHELLRMKSQRVKADVTLDVLYCKQIVGKHKQGERKDIDG